MAENIAINIRLENIAPILYVKNMQKSLAFYTGILGFINAPWGNDTFTLVSRDNTGIYLCRGGQGSPGTWIWVGFDGDINSLYRQLLANSVTIKVPPTNFYWAYEMQVLDPDGHVLRFGTDPDDSKPFASGW